MLQPLYLMAKPPPATTAAIDRLRRHHGIDTGYGVDRLHVTILRLGEGRDVTAAQVMRLAQTVAMLGIEPLHIRFDTLTRNTLTGQAMAEVRAARARLASVLTPLGFPLLDHGGRPHMTLAYGLTSDRSAAVEPIAWIIDHLFVVRSHHGAGRHEHLAHCPLAARQGAFAL